MPREKWNFFPFVNSATDNSGFHDVTLRHVLYQAACVDEG